MSAAVFITTQLQQLTLVCEKHSRGLKAFLQIKGASDRLLFQGQAAQVDILKEYTGLLEHFSSAFKNGRY